MVTTRIKKIEKPIIVISGDHGTGKSYIHKRISKYIQSSVSLNKYDFITRKLLYILDIHPLLIGYVLLDNDMIDRQLYSTDSKMKYLKEKIQREHVVSKDSLEYFLYNILKVESSLYTNEDMAEITATMNRLYNMKHKQELKGQFYGLTKFIFDNVITKAFKWNLKERVYKYLDLRFPEFKRVYDQFQKRIVYYAYSIHEVEYFKERYNAENIFISMKPHLQSQLLMKQNKIASLDETLTHAQRETVSLMRASADCVIENNLEMDNKIINKIMNTITI